MHSLPTIAASTVSILALCASAAAQLTERVSIDSFGGQANADSNFSAVSADGRFIAFASSATNLVPGGTVHSLNVFRRDRANGTTELASASSLGIEGNGLSSQPAISADGQYIVFVSSSSNLVPGDTNTKYDVFVRDAGSGTTSRVSVDSNGVEGNGHSGASTTVPPAISADGRYVAFDGHASNLVPMDTNGLNDVFVHDRQTGAAIRASLDSNGAEADGNSYMPSLSADGRMLAFTSLATNLVAGDTNGKMDVFVRDLDTGITLRVSVASNGSEADGASTTPMISADGRHVVFASLATNLVAGDTNGANDVFVHDLGTGTTRRVSTDSNGAQGDSESNSPSISADGRFTAFRSSATNLVLADTNSVDDVFVRDDLTSAIELASLSAGGAQGNGGSYYPTISVDGRYIAFDSYSTNLVAGDTTAFTDVFVRDRGPVAPIAFCAGDGSSGACPCANGGATGRGCENSAGTGGALLAAAGTSSLASDSLVLTSSGELPSALSIFLQGDVATSAAHFGDGLRCVGGHLKRLFTASAVLGAATAPHAGEPSFSARSAALGDPIVTGATRHYQAYYRDPNPSFCVAPVGNTWNVSSGLSIVWAP